MHKDLLIYEEEGEILLINMTENMIYSLDLIGSIIWKKFVEYKKISEIVDYLYENSCAERKMIENDIMEFVHNLEKVGIIKIAKKN